MMPGGDDISPFEGLIFSTAARYAPYLDDEMEDIQQLLRIKVWQALRAFDPRRATQPREGFVFSCVRNRVKDMLKAQYRLNSARESGAPIYVEDMAAASPDRFERDHLSVDGEVVFAAAEDEGYRLPSTLTELEVHVVHLLLLNFNQTESAAILGVTRQKVRVAHLTVQEKMADWRPGAGPGAVAAPRLAVAA
jgi:RNA polymerase sigma factor (sigma-70 family)